MASELGNRRTILKPTPILFLSDNPSMPTGLARITKDLATQVSSMPQYRVGVLGRGYPGSSKLPFYHHGFPESDQWGENLIEQFWMDFAGVQNGVIMTIWDLSRLDWFARPRMEGPLGDFLRAGRFQRWAYVPVDHYGIGGKLTGLCADTLLGFDRVLAYTLFGKQVLEDTLGREVDWMPHGINGAVFKPRDKAAGRAMLGVREDEDLIGCVMTNQSRKDWGVAFATAARLANANRKFWFHTDTPIRYWNLYALAADFNIQKNVIITNNTFTSEELSYLYSACDITFLPSLGEGFGYPIVESLACGIPVVHGNYAGGVELVPERDWLVDPQGTRLDTIWNCVRPVWDPATWSERLTWALVQHSDGSYKDICTRSVEHLQWKNLWRSCWYKWFMEGLQ